MWQKGLINIGGFINSRLNIFLYNFDFGVYPPSEIAIKGKLGKGPIKNLIDRSWVKGPDLP